MIFTFYKARGLAVGASLVEEDKLALAKELEEKAKVGRAAAAGTADCMVAPVWLALAHTAAVGDSRRRQPGWPARAHAHPTPGHPPPRAATSHAHPTHPEPPPQAKGVEFVLPTDVVVADKFAPDANTQVVDVTAIPDGWMVSPLEAAGSGAGWLCGGVLGRLGAQLQLHGGCACASACSEARACGAATQPSTHAS